MAKNLSEEDVREKLSEVKHPAIDRTLIDLGIVKDIAVQENEVTITMALPFSGIPLKDQLINSVRKPVEELGVKVEVKTEVMNQEEKQSFLAKEQESWRGL